MRIREEIREKLPPKCRKCPVVERFEILLSNAEAEDSRALRSASEALNEAEVAELETEAGVMRYIGEMEGGMALQAAEFHLQNERNLNLVLGEIDHSCPGSVRGSTDENQIVRVLDYVTGERVCRNPNFIKFLGHEAIFLQLKLGNWQSPDFRSQES